MCEQEFDELRAHIDGQMAELRKCISAYPTLGYNDKTNAYAQIRDQCDQITQSLSETDATAVTWPSSLQAKVREYTSGVRAEFANIQYRFTTQVSEDNRQQLMGDEYTKTLPKEQLANAAIDEMNDTREIGLGILEEMGRQRATIGNISGNLTLLGSELDAGESLLNEMECRSRQRTLFLYGVIAFLLLTLAVFVYYILK